jgi:chromosomal replication initiator protein
MYETTTATCSMNYWAIPSCVKVVKQISPQYIIECACCAFKLQKVKLLSSNRSRDLVMVRNICMYLIKQYTGLSLKSIGNIFNRDHTTVIHGLRCINNDLSVPSQRQEVIDKINKVIEFL